MKKFYCDLCKDRIARTRKGMRGHFGEIHKRNEYFGSKITHGEDPMKTRDEKVRRVEMK